MRLVWEGDKVEKEIEKAFQEALWKWGQLAVTECTPNVPIESGTLRRSATVTVGALPSPEVVHSSAEGGREMASAYPRPIGDKLTGYVSYNAPYAVKLHEDMSWSPRIAGGPKWLEKGFQAVKGLFAGLVKREIKKRGGG